MVVRRKVAPYTWPFVRILNKRAPGAGCAGEPGVQQERGKAGRCCIPLTLYIFKSAGGHRLRWRVWCPAAAGLRRALLQTRNPEV